MKICNLIWTNHITTNQSEIKKLFNCYSVIGIYKSMLSASILKTTHSATILKLKEHTIKAKPKCIAIVHKYDDWMTLMFHENIFQRFTSMGRLFSLLRLSVNICRIVILIFVCFTFWRASFFIPWWLRRRARAWSRPGLLWGFWSRSWLWTGPGPWMPGWLGVRSVASWWSGSWFGARCWLRAAVVRSWTRPGLWSVFRSWSAPWSRTWARSWAFLRRGEIKFIRLG